MLSVDSLKIGYGTGKRQMILLPPLSATAETGELVAVIGRNGIGKSTLLRTISGIQPVLGGNVFINRKNIAEISRLELARTVGYISTEIIRVSNMTVFDLTALGRFPHTNWIGKIDAQSRDTIDRALFRTGMSALAGRYVAELSDGERQRAMIARVLAQDADILVMDEPTAFLDIMSRHEIVSLMHELTREGKTIIFSTHDFGIALSQADKIWLTLDDRLTEGAPEDLVISGAFDRLFDSASIGFNPADGTFTFRSESGGKICIKGEGPERLWTERALKRAGFTLLEEFSLPYIQVQSAETDRWQLVASSGTICFRTIYGLIKHLETNLATFS